MNAKEQIIRNLYEEYDILCEAIDIGGKPYVFCSYYNEKPIIFFVGGPQDDFIPIKMALNIADIPDKPPRYIFDRINQACEMIFKDTNCKLEYKIDKDSRFVYAETIVDLEVLSKDEERMYRRISNTIAKLREYVIEDVAPYIGLFMYAINTTEDLVLRFEKIKCDAIKFLINNFHNKRPVMDFRSHEYELDDELTELNEMRTDAIMICLRKNRIPHYVSYEKDGTVLIAIPQIYENTDATFTCSEGDVLFGTIVDILQTQEDHFYQCYATLCSFAADISKDFSDFTIGIIREKPEIAIMISSRLIIGKLDVSVLGTINQAQVFIKKYRSILKMNFPRCRHLEGNLSGYDERGLKRK